VRTFDEGDLRPDMVRAVPRAGRNERRLMEDALGRAMELIYRRDLRAVQLLLGHTKVESTVRYPGIEVDDALAIAEQIDVRPPG
jgi:hypothetical protein